MKRIGVPNLKLETMFQFFLACGPLPIFYFQKGGFNEKCISTIGWPVFFDEGEQIDPDRQMKM